MEITQIILKNNTNQYKQMQISMNIIQISVNNNTNAYEHNANTYERIQIRNKIT